MTEAAASQRKLVISAEHAHRTLAQVVRTLMDGAPWSKARELCERGKVRVNGDIATDSARRLVAGDEVEIQPSAPRLRANALPEDAIIYVDAHVVVVNKPAGLITVPFHDGEKDTLVDRVRAQLRRRTGERDSELGVVQRLDKDTTGVMLFTRTLAAKRHLQQQFRVHSIERRYIAIVAGAIEASHFDTWLLQDRGDGIRGSYGHFRRPQGPVPRAAQRAVTDVTPLETLTGATLVECQLHTGRQHQIRIHLSEAGHPLLGESVYIRDYTGPRLSAPRPMLHARWLGFEHPKTGKTLRFSQDAPADFREVHERLQQPA